MRTLQLKTEFLSKAFNYDKEQNPLAGPKLSEMRAVADYHELHKGSPPFDELAIPTLPSNPAAEKYCSYVSCNVVFTSIFFLISYYYIISASRCIPHTAG